MTCKLKFIDQHPRSVREYHLIKDDPIESYIVNISARTQRTSHFYYHRKDAKKFRYSVKLVDVPKKEYLTWGHIEANDINDLETILCGKTKEEIVNWEEFDSQTYKY